jgi:hypothetical protein
VLFSNEYEETMGGQRKNYPKGIGVMVHGYAYAYPVCASLFSV